MHLSALPALVKVLGPFHSARRVNYGQLTINLFDNDYKNGTSIHMKEVEAFGPLSVRRGLNSLKNIVANFVEFFLCKEWTLMRQV